MSRNPTRPPEKDRPESHQDADMPLWSTGRSFQDRLEVLREENRSLENALRESEARFRDVVQLSSDWYWEQDENFRATYFATEVGHSGYEGSSLLGQTRWEQPGVDLDSADFEAHRAICEAHQAFRDFTYRRVGRDRVEHWISASGQPLFDHAGHFRGYRGVARDVTQQKQAERSLQQAQRFLDALINAIPSPVLVKDNQHRFIAANAAFCGFFRRTAAQILGRSDYDFFRPADAEFYQATDTRALEQGDVVEYERPYTLDGTTQWMLVRKCGLTAPDGRRLVVLLLLDVTQRRAAEEALRHSEARFRSLAHLSADWYWEQDEALRFTFISSEADSKSGWGASSGRGVTRWDHPGVDKSSADWEAHKATCEAHRPFRDFIYRPISEAGSARWLAISGEPVFDAGGQFKGYRGVGRDVTERKRAEQEIGRGRDFYAALSQTNRAIIHIHEPIALAKEVCRVAVEYGHFCLVWTGLLDETTGWLQALAIAGPASAGYPGIRVSINPDVPEGRGFSGAALREGKHYVVNDYFADARVAPWIQHARGAGVKSMATFPLKEDGRCVGLLNLHGDEVGFFTEELVALLEEMAANLSFALTNMRREGERETAQRALRDSEQKFRQLASNIPEVFWIADPGHTRVTYVSPAYEQVWGRSAQHLLDNPRDRIDAIHPADRERVESMLRSARFGRFDHEYRIARPDGTVRWIHDRAFPLLDEHGAVVCITGIAEDITARKEGEERLLHLAHYDTLTGLPNRTLFYDRLEQSLAHSRREGRAAAVIFIDLDHFKLVNDTLGHAAGDHLLQQAARRLKETLRTGDTVGRLGGDEFAVILSDLASADDAGLVTQKLTRVLERPFDVDGQEMFVTASLGITLFPSDGEDPATLLKNADAAMYRAKELGRNNCQLYRSEMNARSRERMSLAGSLRRALERNEFLLHYQPQVELQTGRIIGIEALIRWQHPEMGMVSPAKFIPVAEETGLIVPIGNWVLHTACAQNKAFHHAGLPAMTVAVNLSARQFRQKGLVKSVRAILEATGLDPRYLELEITESMVMHNAEEVITTLSELEGMRLQLSVDDFGTGYSSLNYLKRFPVHRLKIDQSFVRDIGTDPDDTAIVQSIIALGHSLNLKVIAEGVETAGQLAFLENARCDEAQGYYFSRPAPPDEIKQFIASRLSTPVFPPRQF
jgi:diguanylate cyclase (GGDEF)-like protein/PAS domain S-box-containing protein